MEEKNCLTCEFEPKWDNPHTDTCEWYYRTKIPTHAVTVIPKDINKEAPIKNCPAWRPKQ